MVKMLFEFNEKLIKEQSEYPLEIIKELISQKFTHAKCEYEWNGNTVNVLKGKDIYCGMLYVMGSLSRSDWFVPYITRWEWIDDNGVDDIIEGYKKMAIKNPERKDLEKWLRI